MQTGSIPPSQCQRSHVRMNRSAELLASSFGACAPRVLEADCLFRRTALPRFDDWWSQTGSNRRPHACKARALPAELWPRNQKTNAYVLTFGNRNLSETRTHSMKVVGLGRLELPTSRLSSARSNQLSYRPEVQASMRRKRNEGGGNPALVCKQERSRSLSPTCPSRARTPE